MKGFKRYFSRWQNWLGLIIVAFFIVVAVAAPLLSPQDPKNPGPYKAIPHAIYDFQPKPPSPEAPLGTLSKGVDVYHSLVWGSRTSLVFGLLTVIFSVLIGVLIGTVSAFSQGFLSDLLMRITDSFLAFPLIAALVVINQLFTILLSNVGAVYSPGLVSGAINTGSLSHQMLPSIPKWAVLLSHIDPVMIAFILFSWMPFARLTNTTVMHVKRLEYIEAAKIVGVNPRRIIFRHLIPNSISPAIVLAARDVGGVVLLQATFTFIGIGSSSTWGTILVLGRDWIISPGGIFTYWWVFVPATLALILFGIGWNLIGDGLNDALNPRTA